MMDFAALPPEVNSARIYAGAGAGPLMMAASAWDQLASGVTSAANSYRAVISELTDGTWQGPASASMVTAVEPYMVWMNTIAVQAEQTAGQVRAAAAAFEQAFMATVPPQVIAANRALLSTLVATNVFGQNAPAIAANQAQYAEFWAQDAVAMHGYQAASAAATVLSPFTEPAQTTNPAGSAGQAAATSQAQAGSTAASSVQSVLSQVPNALASAPSTQGLPPFLESILGPNGSLTTFLGTNPAIGAFNTFMEGTTGFQSVIGGFGYGSAGFLLSAMPGVNAGIAAASTFAGATYPAAAAAGAAAGMVSTTSPLGGAAMGGATLAGGGGVTAGLGQGAPLGELSVPQSWASTAPQVRLAASALSATGSAAAPAVAAAPMPGGMLGGVPMVNSMVNAPRNGDARVRSGGARPTVMPGEAGADTPDGWVRSLEASDGTLTERDQLNELRKAVERLVKERDVLERQASKLIKQVTQW